MSIVLAQHLSAAIEGALPKLLALSDSDAERRPTGKWSCKEELGHLIDSASNNHLRFVRAALEPEFHGPSYNQSGSVALHGYHELAWSELVDFWRRYNLLLSRLIARIPESQLATPCRVGDSQPVTLQFLIEDYVSHLQGHLAHILQ